jgi:hypothetical protein
MPEGFSPGEKMRAITFVSLSAPSGNSAERNRRFGLHTAALWQSHGKRPKLLHSLGLLGHQYVGDQGRRATQGTFKAFIEVWSILDNMVGLPESTRGKGDDP